MRMWRKEQIDGPGGGGGGLSAQLPYMSSCHESCGSSSSRAFGPLSSTLAGKHVTMPSPPCRTITCCNLHGAKTGMLPSGLAGLCA